MRDQQDKLRKIVHGLIPWDVDSFLEAHVHAARLKTTPKDDWDNRDRSIALDISQGPEQDLAREGFEGLINAGLVNVSEQSPGRIVACFNTSAFVNQITVFIRDKHDDPHVGMAHAVRFLEMGHFFRVHRRRLVEEELIRFTPEEDPVLGVRDEIHEALLRALCELPYKGQRRQGPSGHAPTFKLGAVLKRAKQLIAEEGNGGKA